MSVRPVVLVHGLWMSRHAMLWLQYWFRRRGYRACSHSYSSIRRSLDDNAVDLARRITEASRGPVDVVCHSYGGLVILRTLALDVPLTARRIVLLGSPVGGCLAARRLGASPIGQWLLGKTCSVWRNGPSLTIPDGVEVGAIAGSRPIGLGRLFSRIDRLNDGVVAVEETRGEGLTDHVTLDCAHSGMLFSPRVARQAEHFLRHGRFAR